jgi:hypothetical protein
LRTHCADVGRDPDEIELSVGTPRGGPDRLGPALIEAGVTMFTVGLDGPDYDDLAPLKRWIDWRASL